MGIPRTSFFFLIAGFISIFSFYFNLYFPIILSLLITVIILFFFLIQFNQNKAGFLICIILGIYLLPFIHIIPFIFFDFNIYPKPDQLWWWDGYSVEYTQGYMIDESAIKLTAMLGATGALGFAFGKALINKKNVIDKGFNPNGTKRLIPTMSFSLWLLWALIGLSLGFLAAAKTSIFGENYTDSKSITDTLNFSSAGMIYMSILTFVYVDALLDFKKNKTKFILSIILLLYVIIWLELLRGEREALPWILGLFIAYKYWAYSYLKGKTHKIEIPWIKFILSILIILFISMILSYSRSQFSVVETKNLSNIFGVIIQGNLEGTITFYKLFRGTWTGVMTTPLSVAGDYVRGVLDFKWGKDYLNLFLSLPPGFMAEYFGYDRPLSNLKGPAYEVTFGPGGVHLIVVKFKNFSIVGVFLISAIISFIFSNFESKALKKLSVINLSFLIIFFFVTPEWLWYGDKYLTNAFIIWFILSFFYKVSLGFTFRQSKKKFIHEI
jgi:hypothetical protein